MSCRQCWSLRLRDCHAALAMTFGDNRKTLHRTYFHRRRRADGLENCRVLDREIRALGYHGSYSTDCGRYYALKTSMLGLGTPGGDRQLLPEDQDRGARAGGRHFSTWPGVGRKSSGDVELCSRHGGRIDRERPICFSPAYRRTSVHLKSASIWVAWYTVIGDGIPSSLVRSLAT